MFVLLCVCVADVREGPRYFRFVWLSLLNVRRFSKNDQNDPVVLLPPQTYCITISMSNLPLHIHATTICHLIHHVTTTVTFVDASRSPDGASVAGLAMDEVKVKLVSEVYKIVDNESIKAL